MQIEIVRRYTFEAAHFLPRVPETHKCRSLHGHTYRLCLRIRGPVSEAGWVMDFKDVDEVARPLVRQLDHSVLNHHNGLDNPTAEAMAAWFAERLLPSLPGLASVEIQETDRGAAVAYV